MGTARMYSWMEATPVSVNTLTPWSSRRSRPRGLLVGNETLYR